MRVEMAGDLKKLFLGLWVMGCVTAQGEAVFRAVEVDKKIDIGYGVAVADVDGDKKPDILLADSRQVVWYRNPTWKKFVIAENLTPRDNVCLAARDINGDGKAEVAVGAEWNPGDTINSGAVFYLVPPKDRTKRWQPVKLSHEPTVHRMRWVRNIEGNFDLVVLPLHGRGNRHGEGSGVRVLAYKMPADPTQPWKTELIDDTLHLTHNFSLVDWSMGDDEEPLIGGKEGVFRFVRMREKAGWKKSQFIGGKVAAASFRGAGEVRAGKLPDGKDFIVTVEPMHGNEVVVYATPKGDRPVSFSDRIVLDDSFIDGHALGCGDFLGVGSDQVVAGWRAMSKPGASVGIRMFTPLDADGHKWQTSSVDDNTMACEDLAVADLNGDGRLDIVASGRATKNVKIYFNETPPAAAKK